MSTHILIDEDGTKIIKSEQEFRAWLETAKPGDEVCYHFGVSCYEADAKHVTLEAAILGMVFLYQRRQRLGLFWYMARRVTPETGRIIAPRYQARN